MSEILANIEVAGLDLLLRLFQGLVDPGVNDRLILLETQSLEHRVQLVRPEDAHEIILERQEELGVTGIALPAGSPAQLIIDAPAFVALRAEDEQAPGAECLLLQPCDLRPDLRGARILIAPADVFDVGKLVADAHVRISAELDIGAAPRHVGCNGDRPRHARLCDDVGLLLMVAGVEDRKDFGL